MTTVGCYGHGKKLVLEVITDPEAREFLGRMGECLELENEVRADMKAFILSNVYEIVQMRGDHGFQLAQIEEEECDLPST